MKSIQKISIHCFLLCSLFFILPFVSSLSLDIGHVNFPDPVIEVTYDEPVILLEGQTFIAFYTLASQTTIGTSISSSLGEGYVRKHNISPSSQTLAPRRYIITVSAQDVEGIIATDSVSFNVTGLDFELFDIDTLEPSSGFFTHAPYNITISTFVLDGETNEKIPFNAECKFMDGRATILTSFTDPRLQLMNSSNPSLIPNQYQNAQNTLGTLHEIEGLQTPIGNLSIFCRNYKRDGSPISPVLKHFTIGYLSTPPTITLQKTPEIVINMNNPISSITALTSQESFCTITTPSPSPRSTQFSVGATQENYSSYTTQHNHLLSFSQNDGVNIDVQGELERKTFNYTIDCTNRAGLSSQKNFSIVIDLEQSLKITVLQPSSSFTASSVLSFQTNFPALCSLNSTATNLQSNDILHNITLGSLQSGNNYSYEIFCNGKDSGFGKNATAIVFFTYDTTSPTMTLQKKDPLCPNNVVVLFNTTSSDVEYYFWNLSHNGSLIDSGRITQNSLRLYVQTPGTYLFTGYAQDFTKLNSTIKTLSLSVLSKNSTACQALLNASLVNPLNTTTQIPPSPNGSFTTDPLANQCPYVTCTLDTVCNDACALESRCSPDPDCDASSSSTTDSENSCPHTCREDNMCVEGCAENTSCIEDVDCRKNFSWFAFSLVFLGFVLIAGAGYYLYFMQTRKTPHSPSSTSFSQAPTSLPLASSSNTQSSPISQNSSSEQARAIEQIEQHKKQLLEKHQMKVAERKAKRDSVFEAFSDKTDAPEQLPPTNKESSKEVSQDSFIQKQTSSKDTRTIFEKLDSFIKRNKK